MWSKLLTLSGVLLFVAACETAPDGSAEGAGEGAGGKEVWSVEHEGAGGAGAGADADDSNGLFLDRRDLFLPNHPRLMTTRLSVKNSLASFP